MNLHRFVIHGVEYGISYAGGSGFRDDPHRVYLADLGLRPTELSSTTTPAAGLERFNRRAVDRALAGLTEKQRRVA